MRLSYQPCWLSASSEASLCGASIVILSRRILLQIDAGFSDDEIAVEDYMTPESEPRLARLRQAAVELDVSPNTPILAWLRHSDPPVLPVIGASSIEQLEENLAASDVILEAN